MIMTMIDLRELAKYQYCEDEIKITCTDGQVISGQAGEVDDEESGLGEPGITVYLKDGGWVGIGLSEIDTISVPSKLNLADSNTGQYGNMPLLAEA